MIGIISSLLFGGIVLTGWIRKNHYNSYSRNNALTNNYNIYPDNKGILHDTHTGKAITATQAKELFSGDIYKRIRIIDRYHKLINDNYNTYNEIDPEWFTLEDYVKKYLFRNNSVTGKKLFPEYDWDNMDSLNKPLRKPPVYLWVLPTPDADANGYPWKECVVFDTQEEAMIYNNNYLGGRHFPEMKEDKYIYRGILNILLNQKAKFIIYKTGEIYGGDN